MNNTSKVKIWIGLVAVILVAVATLNYVIDPLWIQPHSNSLNNKQAVFNERQQKTNKLYFGGMQEYDALMLGSSRGALFNQNDFEGMKLFNYSANNMAPWEYAGWIEVAKKIKGSDFKNIVIAIDFFGTQSHWDRDSEKPERQPQSYLSRAQDNQYPYRSLLSFDTAKNAFKSLMKVMGSAGVEYYDRNNVKYVQKVSKDQRDEYIKWNIEDHQKDFGKNYKYKEDWVDLLQNIKAKNPNTHFTILTTPVTQNWFDAFVINSNHHDDYKRWLRETVAVFGEVHHFMDLNSVTKNSDNFFDAHHVYPQITQMMTNKIIGIASAVISTDFGIVLTSENINTYLEQ